MIGKKTMLWIGAGLVSAVSIPAIGATLHRHHKLVHVKPVSHAAQVFHAVHRASIKPATHTVKHAVKPATLLASHVVKKHKSLKTKVANSASRPAYGVLAMHSGRATVEPVGGHLLAAVTTTKHKMHR